MIIRLDLTYVLRRTCDGGPGPRTWVGWCPQLDVTASGSGIAATVWATRFLAHEMIRARIRRAEHPSRAFRHQLADDPDWDAYNRFLSRGGNRWRSWSSCPASDLPASVDLAFANIPTQVDTCGGSSLVSEPCWYGTLEYETGQTVSVRVLQYSTYEVELDRMGGQVSLAGMRSQFGDGISEIIDWTPVEPT